jgi:2-dehydro-3-deoxyphosphogluconate aldolase/(4S)-4-hydroxy-2-oxoglutarate aldolase
MTGEPHPFATVGPVVPVVVLDDAAQAVPLARALAAGGVKVMEVTLRTPAGVAAIERVAAEVPEVLVGAGSVRTPQELDAVCAVGASFVVLPGAPPRLLDAALDSGVPVVPGASTVTEMMTLAERGIALMKFFPGGGVRGCAVPVRGGSAAARPSVLPDRGRHRRQRPQLPVPAQRGLRRRLLAHRTTPARHR